MKALFCNLVQAWLQDGKNNTPDEELVAHVTGCNRCRGALALLLGDLHMILSCDSPHNPCIVCQRDLAAYLEAEANEVAAQDYPHIWRHLRICRECAELYRLLRVLSDSEASGEMEFRALPRQNPRAIRALPRIRIPQLSLAHALTPHTQLGVAWGSAKDELFLAEEDEGSHRLSLSVQPQLYDGCTVIVRVTPPINGLLLLQLGQAVFRTRFDSYGTARIAPIPLNLLTVPGGPDLVVMIEPADVG